MFTRWLASGAAPSDARGTLVWTRLGSRALAPSDLIGPSSVSSHAAGELRPCLEAPAGHGVKPCGTDAVPGAAITSLVPQLAPGPEAGHCAAPRGSVTVG